MRVKDLLSSLKDLNPELDLYLEVDGKFHTIELSKLGPFLNAFTISAKVDIDVALAEQSLMNILQYSRESLTGLALSRIVRALGQERVDCLTKLVDDKMEKEKLEAEEREKHKGLIEQIQEDLNRSDVSHVELSSTDILEAYYMGSSNVSIEQAKKAKIDVGEEVALEIFNRVRRK
jgi:hypothetical protein